MNAKIVSDSSAYRTRVVLPSGEELQGVTSIEWRIAVDDVASCDVRLIGVPLEVEGQLRIHMVHPLTGEMREVESIVFAGGEAWSVEP